VTAQQMQQVLLNLLNNAEQAITKNGRPGIIQVAASRKNERVIITVADNGTGIPAHVLPNIFDPFFTTKKLGEGTGLGLSIAHTLIENHGGSIFARSSPGNTVFTMELPLAAESELSIDTRQTQPLPKPPAREAIKRGRILVVDDEVSIVDAISDFLDLQNIEVDKANDGAEAVRLLEKGHYDAIVSDIRMPGIDGPQLYEKAAAIDPDYRNRFLFMSGDLVRESTQSFVSTLECPCLLKPFPLQVLFQHLQPHLNREAQRHGITQLPPVMRSGQS
jgi:CheY-like chemotaxis protein